MESFEKWKFLFIIKLNLSNVDTLTSRETERGPSQGHPVYTTTLITDVLIDVKYEMGTFDISLIVDMLCLCYI